MGSVCKKRQQQQNNAPRFAPVSWRYRYVWLRARLSSVQCSLMMPRVQAGNPVTLRRNHACIQSAH
jgi:hypothetical protein